jgi:hypothetical protein
MLICCVQNVLPLSSHWVPNMFSISFALSSTRVQKQKITTYLFWGLSKARLICFVMSQSKMPITKRKF